MIRSLQYILPQDLELCPDTIHMDLVEFYSTIYTPEVSAHECGPVAWPATIGVEQALEAANAVSEQLEKWAPDNTILASVPPGGIRCFASSSSGPCTVAIAQYGEPADDTDGIGSLSLIVARPKPHSGKAPFEVVDAFIRASVQLGLRPVLRNASAELSSELQRESAMPVQLVSGEGEPLVAYKRLTLSAGSRLARWPAKPVARSRT